MQKKQMIYAACLGVLSLIMLVAWTIQAIYLADGTYNDPIMDGWVLTAFLLISPFATGFAVALERPKSLFFTALRVIVLCQIPIFALALSAASAADAVEQVMKIIAAVWTMLTALAGVAVSLYGIRTNRD